MIHTKRSAKPDRTRTTRTTSGPCPWRPGWDLWSPGLSATDAEPPGQMSRGIDAASDSSGYLWRDSFRGRGPALEANTSSACQYGSSPTSLVITPGYLITPRTPHRAQAVASSFSRMQRFQCDLHTRPEVIPRPTNSEMSAPSPCTCPCRSA